MIIMYSARDVTEHIWTDEECIQDSASTIEADQAELVSQSYALRHMVREWQAKEEVAGKESQKVAKGLDGQRVYRFRRRWRQEQ
jgi:hypothetical protein